ncbi:extensin family protein [[Pseudomonas] carboxydohydrogena]|uniref:Extensin family protein n=1 Tax=Afipia carboxydohydrogena TaxID=290 RepID=A0ABY8BLI5_AFICR|nr:extensin family protein [[Pseudomonas] carboxydohydrogena]
MLGLSLTMPSVAETAVPLPQPRPAEAPAAAAAGGDTAPKSEEGNAAAPAPPAAPEPSACRRALTGDIAIAPSIAPIHEANGCGGDDLVKLEAVVLRGGQRVDLKPAATLRCEMARAVADWIRDDAEPLAESLGSVLRGLDNFDSYECRGRNRVKGAKLSEHGKANALDVRSLDLANGTKLSLTDRGLSREIREKVLWSVCGRFTTVLGPGSDWYHEDHIHLDIAQRRNNYKLCQWNVYDPLPETPPLLPAERPSDAPPRAAAVEQGTAASGEAADRQDEPAREK